jgi:hypothetical protein
VASESEMAPKKSEIEGKKKEAQLSTEEWTYSKCSLTDLNRLVSEGLLQEKNLVNWRPSFREPFPMENVDEIVTFYHFAEWGLALPSCSFFRGILYYYGLELHHLNPNSICHISILSISVKPFSESNPTGIFSASSSSSNPSQPRKNFLLWGVPAFNCVSRPAKDTSHTNSRPTFPVGKTIGSILKITPPSSPEKQITHLW